MRLAIMLVAFALLPASAQLAASERNADCTQGTDNRARPDLEADCQPKPVELPKGASAMSEQTKTPHSPEFEKFRFSFFDDPNSARDALDISSLTALQGDERVAAETMLIDFLPDSRAIIGLGELRSQRAEAPLLAIFEKELAAYRRDANAQAYDLIWSAQALWRIAPNPRYAEAIFDPLSQGETWVERQDAAMALAEMPTPQTQPALEKALDDPEPLVRHHAAKALLTIHGLDTSSMSPSHAMYRIMSDDIARREGGKRDILAAIAGAKP